MNFHILSSIFAISTGFVFQCFFFEKNETKKASSPKLIPAVRNSGPSMMDLGAMLSRYHPVMGQEVKRVHHEMRIRGFDSVPSIVIRFVES